MLGVRLIMALRHNFIKDVKHPAVDTLKSKTPTLKDALTRA